MTTVTTSEAAELLGLAPKSIRTVLRRLKVEAVGRDVRTGEKLWDADEIRTKAAARPGRGRRTDLTQGDTP